MSRFVSNSMVPSQKSTVKSVVNPREFGPNDWKFEIDRCQELNWQPGNTIQSDYNYFTLNEPHQFVKNGMFNPLTGQEPIYGHVNYFLNPLAQEQTNSHMNAYGLQKKTRISDNMNPYVVMHAPPNRYPVNVPLNTYKGSMSRPRFN